MLAVAITGSFTSFFKDKDSPLLDKEKPDESDKSDEEGSADEEDTIFSSVIQNSSDSAHLIIIASNTFATDSAIDIASQGIGRHYTAPMEFLQNTIDWSLDDHGLLDIRSRAQFARTLMPMKLNDQLFWEYMNYGLALTGLIVVWLWRARMKKKKLAQYNEILAEV